MLTFNTSQQCAKLLLSSLRLNRPAAYLDSRGDCQEGIVGDVDLPESLGVASQETHQDGNAAKSSSFTLKLIE